MRRMESKRKIAAGAWKTYLIFIVLVLPLVFCISSCTQAEIHSVDVEASSGSSVSRIVEDELDNTTGIALQTESSALLYVNQRLGFTIEFPVEWAGLITLEEEYDLPHRNGGNCITIYHRETRELEGGNGALFFIDCYPGTWTEDDPPVVAGESKLALQTENFAVFVRSPSDVQFSESDEELAARYKELYAQMDYLVTHIKAIQ